MSKPSQLTPDEVKQIAALANLDISESEVALYGPQLSEILNYVKQLESVDTREIEPTSQVTGLQNVSRVNDSIGSRSLPVTTALSNGVRTHKDYFVVPGILEGGES